MKQSNQKLIIIIGIVIILSFIIFYVGQFLFYQKSMPENTGAEKSESGESAGNSAGIVSSPIRYNHISTRINNYKQEIFTLEFDPLDKRIEFKPVLAFDNIFGFEKISEILERSGAYAAINAGFFYEFGDPVGMVAVDGELLTAATGYSPVLVINENNAEFRDIKTEIEFIHDGEKTIIDEINRIAADDSIILYTPDFGSTNRAKKENTSIVLENNIITSIERSSKEVGLKKNSYLISFFGEKASIVDKIGLKAGDRLDIEIKPGISGSYQAYECGSMLVKDGKNVAPDKDRWVGTLNNRDPRTAVGIKEIGNIVLIVADGRQPGYSTGFTGKELADYMISIGVKDAAMLDGGATSQIYVDGMLENRPSDRGIPRPVGGAFVVKVRE